jgi:DNA-binding SARP family transcriptional activator
LRFLGNWPLGRRHTDRVARRDAEIRLLGRFRATAGGRELPAAAFGGRKVRTLLAVLAVDRDRYVSHDALADALWPRPATSACW